MWFTGHWQSSGASAAGGGKLLPGKGSLSWGLRPALLSGPSLPSCGGQKDVTWFTMQGHGLAIHSEGTKGWQVDMDSVDGQMWRKGLPLLPQTHSGSGHQLTSLRWLPLKSSHPFLVMILIFDCLPHVSHHGDNI